LYFICDEINLIKNQFINSEQMSLYHTLGLFTLFSKYSGQMHFNKKIKESLKKQRNDSIILVEIK